MEITKQIIKENLASLGIAEGMKIIVHSSLKAVGNVRNGADAVIDALCELLTEAGTLMMPSFNHGKPYYDGEMFDVLHTPTTNGIIPETFRKRKGVLRSVNPTHSFAVWGKDKEYYTRDHQKSDCMGEDSPIHRLMQDGGYCLLLGVGYIRNTFHHCVESCEGAPCLTPRGEEYPVRLAGGEVIGAHTWGYRDKPCPISDKGAYEKFMSPIEKRGMVGNAPAILYRLSDAYPIIAACLEKGINGGVSCKSCSVKTKVTEWTVRVTEII